MTYYMRDMDGDWDSDFKYENLDKVKLHMYDLLLQEYYEDEAKRILDKYNTFDKIKVFYANRNIAFSKSIKDLPMV